MLVALVILIVLFIDVAAFPDAPSEPWVILGGAFVLGGLVSYFGFSLFLFDLRKRTRQAVFNQEMESWRKGTIEGQALARSEPSFGAEALSVKTGGLTWFDWMTQAVVVVLSPLYIIGFGFGRLVIHGSYSFASLAVSVAVLAGVDLLLLALTSVRRIDIGPDGVTFHYLFNREFGAWSDLSPGNLPAQHGLWFVLRRRPGARRVPVRAHRITLKQAEAILSCKARPNWNLSPAIAQSLETIRTSR